MKNLELEFKLRDATDISESVALLCKYLKLDQVKEEGAVFPKQKNKKIDHTIIVDFAERNRLRISLDFKEEAGVVYFLPKTMDILSVDENIEKDEETSQKEADEVLKEIKETKSKTKTPVKVVIEEEEDDDDDLLD